LYTGIIELFNFFASRYLNPQSKVPALHYVYFHFDRLFGSWLLNTLPMSKPHITDLYFYDELSMTIGMDAANTWYASMCRRSFSRRMSSQRLDDNRPSGIVAPRFSQHRLSSKTSTPTTDSLSRERHDGRYLDGMVLSEAMTEMPSSTDQANTSISANEEIRSSRGCKFPSEGSKPEIRGLVYTDAAHSHVNDRTDQGHPPAPESR
jgi:hypothetical protein